MNLPGYVAVNVPVVELGGSLTFLRFLEDLMPYNTWKMGFILVVSFLLYPPLNFFFFFYYL